MPGQLGPRHISRWGEHTGGACRHPYRLHPLFLPFPTHPSRTGPEFPSAEGFPEGPGGWGLPALCGNARPENIFGHLFPSVAAEKTTCVYPAKQEGQHVMTGILLRENNFQKYWKHWLSDVVTEVGSRGDGKQDQLLRSCSRTR